jgi:hypothetical protein
MRLSHVFHDFNCSVIKGNTVGYATTNDATTNECYNERMLQRTNATTNDATTNECYNEVFINKIRMLQRKQMLQRTRRTLKRCSLAGINCPNL